ncbi:MAG TPA: magnesium/cobalt transporter CorA [candidate division Zixibacteria bacterium]|nr:magnesium/cobalt transporter CorA [candidate division Zixibacteria bacterium]
MTRLQKKVSGKAGMMPGSLVYVGEKRTQSVKLQLMDFTETDLTEKLLDRPEDCLAFKDSGSVSWINVTGIHDVEIVKKIGELFGIHALILEDILNSGQRPKLEEAEDYLFLVIKMLYVKPRESRITSEQVSVIIGQNYVLSFQEQEMDVFDPVRDRIRKTVPRVRFSNTDYLAYALIDAVVDHYFAIVEHLGDRVEEMEERLVVRPSTEDLQSIHELKRELIFMRKAVFPLREVIGNLERTESSLVHRSTRIYLRDLYEHTIQVIDTVETLRDTVSGLLDIYLSSVSNRMNEVMKVLTIIATIFIPLSFLAGVYGMNFDTSASPLNMPELHFPYGYIMFWVIALMVGFGLLWSFKRKRWL